MPQLTAIPTNLRFEATTRKGNKVVAASGQRTRNYDWFSGKYFRIVPAGIRLDNYRNNNVFLWAHDSHSIENVLGNADVQMEGAVLTATPTFHMEHEKSMLASALWNKGVLNAVSVRIGLTTEDIANITETDDEILIPTSELWELSLATIPADAGAVRQAALALGIDGQQVNRWLMEVKNAMDENLQGTDLEATAGEEEALPFFSPEDWTAFAAELVEQPEAMETLRLALVSPLLEENQQQIARITELEQQLAALTSQPATRLPVGGQPARTTRLSFTPGNSAAVARSNQPATPPPAGIRAAQPMATGLSQTPQAAQPKNRAQQVAAKMLARQGKVQG